MRCRKYAERSGNRPPVLLAVTVLTSLNDGDLELLGFNRGTRETALHLARLAQDAGVSGVVASAEDAAAIRKACGGDFLIVTPGIRAAGEVAGDDQKSIVTPAVAISAGADYLVVGRPISQAADPAGCGGPDGRRNFSRACSSPGGIEPNIFQGTWPRRDVVQVIYGINPLLEVLLSHPAMLERIVVAEGRGGGEVRRILNLAAEHGIPHEFCGRERLEKLAPHQVHQGVAGLCRPQEYATVDEVIANRHEKSKYDLVVLLDSVTDPQNLGSIIRTAHCCGANGVIIPENRAASVTGIRCEGFRRGGSVPADGDGGQSGQNHRIPEREGFLDLWGRRGGADGWPMRRIIRGMSPWSWEAKGRGIRPLIRKNCDFLISIPMRGKVASLNVSVAAGVILFGILRKWGN